MKDNAINNREKLNQIKYDMACGVISYDEAIERAAPVVEAINNKACELAKKYGMRPQLVNARALLR